MNQFGRLPGDPFSPMLLPAYTDCRAVRLWVPDLPPDRILPYADKHAGSFLRLEYENQVEEKKHPLLRCRKTVGLISFIGNEIWLCREWRRNGTNYPKKYFTFEDAYSTNNRDKLQSNMM